MAMGGGHRHGGGRGHHRASDPNDHDHVEPLKITDRRMLGWFVGHVCQSSNSSFNDALVARVILCDRHLADLVL